MTGQRKTTDTERDKRIVAYGTGPQALSVETLAERFNLSRNRVAQILGRASMRQSQGAAI